ncbi:RNA-binding protein Nova-1-like isoform X1 [Homarus americanus]|uniref:RNA-binding protein Nova-1-like n=1 Tax=Homarus americanus TaxID=6706 RepID=A0A8J5MNY0_HOMAM|nr:RNA-binding protein Nova-1-like isoform X1 [Homarus americanus]KAG7158389.1 RNA-binding protein Nova-1-like [Homarus americanus]
MRSGRLLYNMASESNMEECIPSPGTPDSRKRPLDIDSDDAMSKRSHYIPDMQSEGTYHLKILVPSVAAGAIIGKGGETIAQLQKDTSARVKMSKANDFYPGTTERVCLITGNVDAICTVLSFIMEKIKEKPDPNAKPAIDFDNKMTAEREKQISRSARSPQVKILVPNSTAGMIIGKGGTYIKQIKEESGAYVQISQKAKDQSLAERCITVISNDVENSKNACLMILAKIVEDPQSGTCLNVSYADITGPVANPNPTGSPFANSPGGQGMQNGGLGGLNNPLSAVSGLGNLLGGGVNLTLNLSSAYPNGGAGNPVVTAQLLEHVRSILRSSGFADQSNAEVCQAINTLINYGIIGLGLGLGNPSGHQGSHGGQGGQGQGNMGGNPMLGNMNNSNNPNESYHGSSMSNGNNGPFGPIGTTVASGLNLGQGLGGPTSPQRQVDRFNSEPPFDPFRRQSTEMGGSLPLNSNSFGLGTPLRKSPSPGELPPGAPDGSKKVEVEVGEHIVGAILGPGGKSLVEIQHISGTTIQISKKGNYAPGTRNRIVTITGLPSGISTAQFLIEQRISEEEGKRARHNAIMGVMP